VRSYVDSTVAASTKYQYQVRARDAAGNSSDLSTAVTVTTPPPSSVLSFTPTHDAYVRADSVGGNFGSATTIATDNSPVKHALLAFSPSGIGSRRVASAKLRLFCRDSSSNGGSVHRVLEPEPPYWTEGGVTWANAPDYTTTPVTAFDAVSAGSWYEVDVTNLVTGDNRVSMRITTPNSNGADYSSKEDAPGFAPQLLVTLAAP
jgi:chitodextrinase